MSFKPLLGKFVSPILVSLDGKIHRLGLQQANETCGLLIPRRGLSNKQLKVLAADMAELGNSFASKDESHFHKPQLSLEGEDLKVLRAILDWPDSQARLSHLKQFIVFRQHNIYVSERLAKQSLSTWRDSVLLSVLDNVIKENIPFVMFEISYDEWVKKPDFNDWVCDHPVNAHVLELLEEFAKKRRRGMFGHGIWVLPALLCLFQKNQEVYPVFGGSLGLRTTVFQGDWYFSDARYRKIHFSRIRKGIDAYDMTLKVPVCCGDEPMRICALNLDEMNEFEDIIARLGFVVPHCYEVASQVVFIRLLVYLYLRLGGNDFEELLRYMQNNDRNDRHDKSPMVHILYHSVELQEAIIAASKLDSALPMSLKLELSDLDWYSYVKTENEKLVQAYGEKAYDNWLMSGRYSRQDMILIQNYYLQKFQD